MSKTKPYPGAKATGMQREYPSDGRAQARGVSRPKHLRKRKGKRV